MEVILTENTQVCYYFAPGWWFDGAMEPGLTGFTCYADISFLLDTVTTSKKKNTTSRGSTLLEAEKSCINWILNDIAPSPPVRGSPMTDQSLFVALGVSFQAGGR